MAEATKKPRKRAKQKHLNGVEPDDRIKEIEDAGDVYEEARDERQALTEREVEAKNNLISVMKKHRKTVYRYDSKTITFEELQEAKVKVKRDKVTEDDE